MLALALIFSIVSFGLSVATIIVRVMSQKGSRTERIARCRGLIEGVRAAELTLDMADSDPAKVVLATMRHHAVMAKHELRLLGIEA